MDTDTEEDCIAGKEKSTSHRRGYSRYKNSSAVYITPRLEELRLRQA